MSKRQGRIQDLKKEGAHWLRGLTPKPFLANFRGFFKGLGAKRGGRAPPSGSAPERLRYRDRHKRRPRRRRCHFLFANWHPTAIFIGSWMAYFSFYVSKNEDNRTPVLVEGLHKLSAKLSNEQPRY